jgi:hypothetical protein
VWENASLHRGHVRPRGHSGSCEEVKTGKQTCTAHGIRLADTVRRPWKPVEAIAAVCASRRRGRKKTVESVAVNHSRQSEAARDREARVGRLAAQRREKKGNRSGQRFVLLACVHTFLAGVYGETAARLTV